MAVNREVDDPRTLMRKVEAYYAQGCSHIAHVDGLSIEFEDWRFNLRMSNTEPVVRLNVETRGDVRRMEQKTEELLRFIDA